MDDSITISGIDGIFFADSPETYRVKEHFTVCLGAFVAHIVRAPHDSGTPYWFLYLYDGNGQPVPGETGNGYATAGETLMAALSEVHHITYPHLVPEEILPWEEPAGTLTH